MGQNMTAETPTTWWQARVAGPPWPGLQVFSTTRAGGVSQAPYHHFNLGDHVADAPAAVAENRQRLQQRLPAAPCWLQQVHGTQVWDADAPAVTEEAGLAAGTAGSLSATAGGNGDDASPPIADAAVTRRAQRVLAILTADCLPVVLFDPVQQVLGVAHAGWRGLAAGVLEATLQAMVAQGAQPRQVQVWLGPAIGPQAFEVGDDVRLAMGPAAAWAFRPRVAVAGKWWCDLPGLAQARLHAAGVVQVARSGLCTFNDSRFYSYRRDGQTGRFVTLAWFNSPSPK